MSNIYADSNTGIAVVVVILVILVLLVIVLCYVRRRQKTPRFKGYDHQGTFTIVLN